MSDLKMRQQALRNLLELNGGIQELSLALQGFGWNSDIILAVLTRQHLRFALNRYLSEELSPSALEEWANLIEGRDDVAFESGYDELLEESIHQLANPVLTEPITQDSIRVMYGRLS